MFKVDKNESVVIDPFTRDSRMTRAVEILNRYQIVSKSQPGDLLKTFYVIGGSSNYLVKIDPTWQTSPSCSCPDASSRAKYGNAGFCKHLIAVLLNEKAFAYQLLDLFI